MSMADRIQHLRKINGLSQEDLANKIGVSRQTISKWESEQSVPDTDKIILLSNTFAVTTDYILKGSECATENNSAYNVKSNLDIVAIWVAYLGYIISAVWWNEYQTNWAVIFSVCTFSISIIMLLITRRDNGLDEKKYYKAIKVIFPIFCFWLMSLIYNFLIIQIIAPYPIIVLL